MRLHRVIYGLTNHRIFLRTESSLPSALFVNPSPLQHSRLCKSSVALFSSPSDHGEAKVNDEFSKVYHLNGKGKASKVEVTTVTGHALCTDVPKKMGGTDSAPQPVETLIAAWMGCTQATAVFVGRQMDPRILIDSLEFEDITAIRDERGSLSLPITENSEIPSRLQKISGRIWINTKNKYPLTNKELNVLQDQTEIRCPVANMMIASGCKMDLVWEEAL